MAPQTWVVGSQHSPARQSASVQQPLVQLPLQQMPLPHCALLVQPQLAALQTWVAVSRHCPARQSAVEQQPETHAPLQHVWPFAHWLVLAQPQAAALQAWVAVSRHSVRPGSPKSTQQAPGRQCFPPPPALPELLEPLELLELAALVRLVEPAEPPEPPPRKRQTLCRQTKPAQQSVFVEQELAAEPQVGGELGLVAGQPIRPNPSTKASPPARSGFSLTFILQVSGDGPALPRDARLNRVAP